MGQREIRPGSTPLVRREIEYLSSGRIMQIPPHLTALYVLYAYDDKTRQLNVRYVGYANGQEGEDVRNLLQQQYKLNGRMWSHFSVYELWDHFQKGDSKAVEALFEHVYRHDWHLKTHIAKNKRDETVDNEFIPKQLFVSFIDRLSRASSKVIDSRPEKPGTRAPVHEL